MIRNVVVGRLREGASAADVEPALAAIRALDPPGCTAMTVGTDLGLREGGWDFAIVADFVDEAAYRAYDAEAEHDRVRAELFAPVCAQVERVQFAL